MNNIAGSVDNLSILLLFFVLHLLTGLVLPFRTTTQPFMWSVMQGASAEIGRRLNRQDRTYQERAARGFVVLSVMLAFAWLIGFAVEDVAKYPYGWIFKVLFLFFSISAFPVIKMLKAVRQALDKKDDKAARFILDKNINEVLIKTDHYTLVRKTIEYAAIQSFQSLFAPALFFAVFGTVGLMCYIAIVSLVKAFTMADPQNVPFGRTAGSLGALLLWIPLRLYAAIVSVSALFVSKSNPSSAVSSAFQQSPAATMTGRAWPIAAFAGALQIALGGPVKLKSHYTVNEKWFGPKEATAKIDNAELKRAEMLYFVFFLCVIVFFSCVFAIKNRFF